MMPTVELVSLECKQAPIWPQFSTFRCLTESRLQSHRALFQSTLDRATGIIVHLGNRDLEEDLQSDTVAGWFAGDLVDWDDDEIVLPLVDVSLGENQWWGEGQTDSFRFLPEVLAEINQLLLLLLQSSPVNQIYFLTDYQFGPAQAIYRTDYTLQRFIAEHDQSGLLWNCLYYISETAK